MTSMQDVMQQKMPTQVLIRNRHEQSLISFSYRLIYEQINAHSLRNTRILKFVGA